MSFVDGDSDTSALCMHAILRFYVFRIRVAWKYLFIDVWINEETVRSENPANAGKWVDKSDWENHGAVGLGPLTWIMQLHKLERQTARWWTWKICNYLCKVRSSSKTVSAMQTEVRAHYQSVCFDAAIKLGNFMHQSSKLNKLRVHLQYWNAEKSKPPLLSKFASVTSAISESYRTSKKETSPWINSTFHHFQ